MGALLFLCMLIAGVRCMRRRPVPSCNASLRKRRIQRIDPVADVEEPLADVDEMEEPHAEETQDGSVPAGRPAALLDEEEEEEEAEEEEAAPSMHDIHALEVEIDAMTEQLSKSRRDAKKKVGRGRPKHSTPKPPVTKPMELRSQDNKVGRLPVSFCENSTHEIIRPSLVSVKNRFFFCLFLKECASIDSYLYHLQ